MPYFFNILENPKSFEKLVISIAAILPNIVFFSFKQLANQTIIQPQAQAGTTKTTIINIRKIGK